MMQSKPLNPDQPADSSDATGELDYAIHDLRNSMNTLMMSAAVLGNRIEQFPESLRPFVERISTSGHQCSQELARVYALLGRGKG